MLVKAGLKGYLDKSNIILKHSKFSQTKLEERRETFLIELPKILFKILIKLGPISIFGTGEYALEGISIIRKYYICNILRKLLYNNTSSIFPYNTKGCDRSSRGGRAD